MLTIDFDLMLFIVAGLILLLVFADIFWVIRFVRRKTPVVSDQKQLINKRTRVLNLARKLAPVVVNILIPVLSIYLFLSAIAPTPAIDYSKSYPAFNTAWNDYSKPIEVVFNMPVQISSLRPYVSPEQLEGDWVYERYLGFLPVTRKAKFYPKRTLLPDERIVVYITGVSRYRMGENHEHALNLFSHRAPEISATSPAHLSEETDIRSFVELQFTAPLSNQAKWEYEFTPNIAFDLITKTPQIVQLIPQQKLNQGETYVLKIYRTSQAYEIGSGNVVDQGDRELVHELQFSTKKAPLVRKFSPTGTGVREDTVIEINFETAMNREQIEEKMTITPVTAVDFLWSDDRKLTLKPKELLTKETNYTVLIPQGVETRSGGVLEQDISYSFTTIGAIRLASHTPAAGAVRVGTRSNITVTFDQEVDRDSAQQAFSVNPGVNGSFTWQDNTSFVFTPSQALAYDTTYTVSLAAGIKSIYGLSNRDVLQFSFTTASNFYLIPGFSAASFYEQRFSMTCAVAAAKMSLAWKGFNVSEETLYNQIGRAPGQYIYHPEMTNPVTGAPGAYMWADPNVGFVGPISGGGGTDPERSFGVYWNPIQRVFRDYYGVNTEVRQGWNINGLAATVEQGRPVQIWAWNGLSWTWNAQGRARMDWYNQSGQPIYAINGMHSWLIVGFYGESSNPTSFIYLDPWRGFVTKPASEFAYHWSFYNNTGLIVY